MVLVWSQKLVGDDLLSVIEFAFVDCDEFLLGDLQELGLILAVLK